MAVTKYKNPITGEWEVAGNFPASIYTSDTAPTDPNITTWMDTSDVGCIPGGIMNQVREIFYPIGSIVYSSNLDTMEKVIAIYGGTTWTKIEGKFILGASETYPVNSTGGEATHILTTDEIPSHSHEDRITVQGYSGWSQYTSSGYGVTINYSKGDYHGPDTTMNMASVSTHTSSGSTGGGQAHNNIPPYKAVYIWERTA